MNNGVLTILLFAAAGFDGRENCIPNWLCAFGAGLGLILHGYKEGMAGVLTSLMSGLLFFFPFFILWLLHILGAGDVKLITVSGIFLRDQVIIFLLWGGICTAVLCLLLMIVRKNFFQRVRQLGFYLEECIRDRRIYAYPFEYAQDWTEGGVRVSYGLLAGHLLALGGGYY